MRTEPASSNAETRPWIVFFTAVRRSVGAIAGAAPLRPAQNLSYEGKPVSLSAISPTDRFCLPSERWGDGRDAGSNQRTRRSDDSERVTGSYAEQEAGQNAVNRPNTC